MENSHTGTIDSSLNRSNIIRSDRSRRAELGDQTYVMASMARSVAQVRVSSNTIKAKIVNEFS
jgi:hypothetical protein